MNSHHMWIQCEFTKEPYERDDILQKRPTILRSLLTYPPHMNSHQWHHMWIAMWSRMQFLCCNVNSCAAMWIPVMQCEFTYNDHSHAPHEWWIHTHHSYDGIPKWQVSFAKEPYDILQKRPIILRSLLTDPPHMNSHAPFVGRRALWKRRYSAKETYNLKEPTNVFIPYEFTCTIRRTEEACHTDSMWIHKRALWKRRYSAKETYNLKEPTNEWHHSYDGGGMSHL